MEGSRPFTLEEDPLPSPRNRCVGGAGPSGGLDASEKRTIFLTQPGIEPGFSSIPAHNLVTILRTLLHFSQDQSAFVRTLHI
jgi:hypothetical protein